MNLFEIKLACTMTLICTLAFVGVAIWSMHKNVYTNRVRGILIGNGLAALAWLLVLIYHIFKMANE